MGHQMTHQLHNRNGVESKVEFNCKGFSYRGSCVFLQMCKEILARLLERSQLKLVVHIQMFRTISQECLCLSGSERASQSRGQISRVPL